MFEKQTTENKLNPLNILYSQSQEPLQPFQLKEEVTAKSLFEGFEEYKLLTYSCSSDFINFLIKQHPKKIELVVGMLDENYQTSIVANIQQNGQNRLTIQQNGIISLFNALNNEGQSHLANGELEVHSPFDRVIHSKVYLMKKDDKCRIILGSANLTYAALSNYQIEELMVIDDNVELYQFYESRFNTIKNHYSFNLVSNKVKALMQKEIKPVKTKSKKVTVDIELNIQPTPTAGDLNLENSISVKNNSSFITLTEEEREDLVVETMKDYNNSYNESLKHDLQLNNSTKEDLKEVISSLQQQKEESERAISSKDTVNEKQKVETIYQVVNESIVLDKDKKPKLQNNATNIKKTYQNTMQIKSIRVNDVTSSLANRVEFQRVDNQVSENDYEGKILQIKNDKVIPFSRLLSKEQIQKELRKIDKIINGYQKYCLNYRDDIGKRIFEAILYTFSSPFISYIRQTRKTNEERQNIPVFCFLGGVGGSGKSSLLNCLNRMTFGGEEFLNVLNFEEISPHTNTSTQTTKTNEMLRAIMMENNVAPLLIDEIPVKFFAKDGGSEKVIKHVSNNIDNNAKTYPVLIGTTNANGYSGERAEIRRSYYLKIDAPFDNKKRIESIDYYNQILNELNNDLFKDFLCRFHLKTFTLDNSKFICADKNKRLDFLSVARDIFKDYYQENDMTLPAYFSDSCIDDYDNSSSNKWRTLFLSLYHNSNEVFSYDRKTNILWFYRSKVDENLKANEERKSDVYLRYLSEEVKDVDFDARDIAIRLNAEEFFKWIGIDNPYDNILNKMFKKIF